MYNPSRAGLYIEKSTRSRLNLFKAQYALKHGRFVNQSEAIDALLDLAGIIRCTPPQVDSLPLLDFGAERPAA